MRQEGNGVHRNDALHFFVVDQGCFLDTSAKSY
jgi:hypothetical protein